MAQMPLTDQVPLSPIPTGPMPSWLPTTYNPMIEQLAAKLAAKADSSLAGPVLSQELNQQMMQMSQAPMPATMAQQLEQGAAPGQMMPPPEATMAPPGVMAGPPTPAQAGPGPNWGAIMQGMGGMQGAPATPPPMPVMPQPGTGKVALKMIGGRQNPYSFMGG